MKRISVLLLALAGLMVFALTGCDSSDYKNAVSLYEDGKYEEAIAAFEALGDYQDSANRILDCKMGIAQEQIEAGDYDAAVTTLKELSDYEGAAEAITQCNLNIAKGLLDSGNAKAAAEKYTEEFASSGSEEAAEGIVACISAVAETDVTAASEIYKNVPEEAKTDSFKFVGGEMLLKVGRLNDAKKAYESVPADFSYEGVTAAERLELLNSHSDLLSICGEWATSKDGSVNIRSTHDSTGRWTDWTFDASGTTMSILCPYDTEKGTFTINGVASYGYCKNYSTLSANVQIGEATASFSVEGDKLPASLPISNENVTMTYSGNAFKLAFKFVDDSSNALFTYTSSGSYTLDKVEKPW